MLATIGICLLLPTSRRWLVLLLASCSFYFAWRPEYLLLLLVTTVSCHFGALLIAAQSANSRLPRRSILFGVVSINLAILFLFKYYGLFAQSANVWLDASLPSDLGFLLPIGISFYTFQAIGYTIDVYQGKIPPERSLLRTTLFVAFFPQLVAGPIERAGRLLPALRVPIVFRWKNIKVGLWLLLWGLFKKVVLADRLAWLVDAAYSDPTQTDPTLLLVATYAFAFQIYCDFSGYSDMAIGSAKIFGIDLMQNFRLPYRATSLREFWSRWHISLSTWLRDYLYIPLGGNRRGTVRWVLCILVVFLASGLWHGAAWTFVIWGGIHGVALLCESCLGWLLPGLAKWKAIWPLRALLTFHIVLVSWVFFRAQNLGDALAILESFTHLTAISSSQLPAEFSRFELAVSLLGLAWLTAVEIPCDGQAQRLLTMRPRCVVRLAICFTLVLVLNFGIFNDPAQFVYFQF